MIFRTPATNRLSGTVSYGPFPIRKGRFAVSFAPLFIAALMPFIALEEEHLVCTPNALCVVTHALIPRRRTLPMAALRDVRVDIEHGSKGATHGVVVLVPERHGELRLMRATPSDASEAAAAIRAGIKGQRPIDVTIHGPRLVLLLGLGGIVMWLSLAYSALKGLGRLRLDIVREGASLRVRRTIFGVPVASHEVSLGDVVDVRVKSGKLGEAWLSRGQAPSPAGYVFLVSRSGLSCPLSARALPGEAVHLRAAAELRALLGFAPERGGVEDQLAALPMVTMLLGQRIGLCWVGVTVGGLAGAAFYGLIGLALGQLKPAEGTLAVGAVIGAIAGVLLVLHVTRAHPRR